jgi:acetyl esterase/lipase
VLHPQMYKAPTGYPIDRALLDAAASLPRTSRADAIRARQAAPAQRRQAGRVVIDRGAVEEHECVSADGHAVALRVYAPHERRSRGVVYHVHGGGFVLGDLQTSHERNLEFAQELGTVVVSVDYRLAPEWPYPAPVEDVYSGLVWIGEQAGRLDIDPGMVALHGVSAGGALAASAALIARDRNGPSIHFLHLKSPTVDDRLHTPSSLRFTDTPAFTRGDAEMCWSAYLGTIVRGDEAVPVYAAPGRASDLRELPRAYVSVAEFDPLRDEAIDFARALVGNGVSVELHLFPGTYHGSSSVREAAVTRRELAEEIAVLANALGIA